MRNVVLNNGDDKVGENAPRSRAAACGWDTAREFMSLIRIPSVIYYGDFIPATPTANPGQDQRRIRLEMAREWRDAVNKRGGDVTVVRLPEVGINGNTHFPFSDLNNLQVADLMPTWLVGKGPDRHPKRK